MNDDKIEFESLEKTLRKALATEKMQGLRPEQLQSLHQKIDGSTRVLKPSMNIWKWAALAAPAIAVALVTFTLQKPESQTAQQAEKPVAAEQRGQSSHLAESRATPAAKAQPNVSLELKAIEPKVRAQPRAAAPLNTTLGLSSGMKSSGVKSSDMKSPDMKSSGDTMESEGASSPRSSDKRARRAFQPITIVEGSIKATGILPVDIVYDFISKRKIFLDNCYNSNKQDTPASKGTLQIAWTVDKKGNPSNVTLKSWTLGDREMSACITSAISKWKFPKESPTKVEITIDVNPT